MRILTRQQFFEMPPGTLYRKVDGHNVNQNIEIKASNCGTDDFVCMDFGYLYDQYDRLEEMLVLGTPFPIETDCYGRDGCFDGPETTFMVFERYDLEQMRLMVEKALSVAPEQIFQKP